MNNGASIVCVYIEIKYIVDAVHVTTYIHNC